MSSELFFSIDENAWLTYANDPLPGWASRSFTLFDSPSAHFDGPLSPGTTTVCSVPFDTTASTRAGARYAPRAIREASLAYSAQLKSRGAIELRNMRTGELLKTKELALADFGDFHVYPSDPLKQMYATAAETCRAMMLSDRLIMLGGEHSLSFASYCGVAAAMQAKKKEVPGYVQIDHHFDFGDTSILHGKLYHGSNARRISEHPLLVPGAMGFVGVGDLTSAVQYNSLVEAGMSIYSIADIRRYGLERCLRETLDRVVALSEQIYVSLDIDVCDTATAPGTGHVTIGGINATELLSIAAILREYPVVALDIMEVSPRFDSSGATEHLAARFLFEWLYLENVKR